MGFARGGLDGETTGQLDAPQGGSRDRPGVTPLLAQAEFEKEDSGVEELLDLRGGEGLRLDERGIARGGGPNSRLDLVKLGVRRGDLLGDRSHLGGGGLLAEQTHVALHLGAKCLLQGALVGLKLRIGAGVDADAGLVQRLDEGPGPAALASRKGLRVVTVVGPSAMQGHEHAYVKIIEPGQRCQIGSPQSDVREARPQGLDVRERLLHLPERFVQVPSSLCHTCQAVKSDGLALPIPKGPLQCQRLAKGIVSRWHGAKCSLGGPDVDHRAGLDPAVTGVLRQGQGLLMIVQGCLPGTPVAFDTTEVAQGRRLEASTASLLGQTQRLQKGRPRLHGLFQRKVEGPREAKSKNLGLLLTRGPCEFKGLPREPQPETMLTKTLVD